jgi:hypothetical protein
MLNANGFVSATGLDDDFGGEVDAKGYDINVNGRIEAIGTTGFGGIVDLFATHNVAVSGEVNTSGALGGGKIKLTGQDLAVPGLLDAESVFSGYSGIIEMFATHDVDVAGELNSSGVDGGGYIKLTGHDITLEHAGKVDAEITGEGARAGRVFMQASHNVLVAGQVNTSGKNQGGNIKLTGYDVNLANGAQLLADGSTTGNGGNLQLTAVHDVLVDGQTHASGRNGGEIDLKGSDVTVGTSADMLARGSNLGGKMVLTALNAAQLNGLAQVDGAFGGGSFKIQGADVGVTALINANANINGKGGMVSLLGTSSNDFSGLITARGGSAGGDGGKVTIAQPNTITGTVDVSAPAGADGTYIH